MILYDPSVLDVLYIGCGAALVATVLLVILAILSQALDLWSRAVWADDATRMGKAKVTIQWTADRTDWRFVTVELIPRVAAVGFLTGVAMSVFAAGLMVILT